MPSIKCAHCKSRHATVAQVKLCSGVRVNPGDDIRPAARLDDAGNYRKVSLAPRPATVATAESPVATLPKVAARQSLEAVLAVPAGKYAVRAFGRDENGPTLKFFEVSHGKPNSKWAGYTFVSQLFGAPGNFRKVAIKNPQYRNEIIQLISQDAEGATALFGLELGICGVCSSPLTNEESRARGIGPVCASKRGW